MLGALEGKEKGEYECGAARTVFLDGSMKEGRVEGKKRERKLGKAQRVSADKVLTIRAQTSTPTSSATASTHRVNPSPIRYLM